MDELAGVLPEYDLAFEVGSPTRVGTSPNGNPIYGKSTVVIRAYLVHRRLAQTAQFVGANEHVIHLRGRLRNPKLLPDTIQPDMTASMVYEGRDGTFTLTGVRSNQMPSMDAVYGKIIYGNWRYH